MAGAFPQAGLAPTSRLRGTYYRWLFFAAGSLDAAALNKALGFDVPEGRSGMAGYGSYAAVMDTLEAAVTSGDYVVGDRFTAADVFLGSHISFGLRFGTVEKRPAFEQHAARMEARPAAVRAREIDDALLVQPVGGKA